MKFLVKIENPNRLIDTAYLNAERNGVTNDIAEAAVFPSKRVADIMTVAVRTRLAGMGEQVSVQQA